MSTAKKEQNDVIVGKDHNSNSNNDNEDDAEQQKAWAVDAMVKVTSVITLKSKYLKECSNQLSAKEKAALEADLAVVKMLNVQLRAIALGGIPSTKGKMLDANRLQIEAFGGQQVVYKLNQLLEDDDDGGLDETVVVRQESSSKNSDAMPEVPQECAEVVVGSYYKGLQANWALDALEKVVEALERGTGSYSDSFGELHRWRRQELLLSNVPSLKKIRAILGDLTLGMAAKTYPRGEMLDANRLKVKDLDGKVQVYNITTMVGDYGIVHQRKAAVADALLVLNNLLKQCAAIMVGRLERLKTVLRGMVLGIEPNDDGPHGEIVGDLWRLLIRVSEQGRPTEEFGLFRGTWSSDSSDEILYLRTGEPVSSSF